MQLVTPDPERGRAFSALYLASSAGAAVGMLAGGLLSGPLGLSVLLNAQALLYLVGGALAATLMVRGPEKARRLVGELRSAPDV